MSEERKKAYGGGESVPNEYLCPITMEIMVDPVIAMDGHTYERVAIENWLQVNDIHVCMHSSDAPRCPK